jgi:hypothetical protein
VFLEPLPPTDEDESPSPTPSELPRYFWNKVSESQNASKNSKASKGLTTPAKVLSPRQIPPSGTPVKLEASTLRHESSIKRHPDFSKAKVKLDPNESSESSDGESNRKSDEIDLCIEEGIRIAHLKPQFSEFTHLFPAFPKTHPNGYAYIIELSPEVLNEKALVDLRDALQYSLTGGGGPRLLENVKFFAVEGEKVPMKIHYRVCAGISIKYVFILI